MDLLCVHLCPLKAHEIMVMVLERNLRNATDLIIVSQKMLFLHNCLFFPKENAHFKFLNITDQTRHFYKTSKPESVIYSSAVWYSSQVLLEFHSLISGKCRSFFFPFIFFLESVTKTPLLNAPNPLRFTIWYLPWYKTPFLTESFWGGFIFIQHKIMSAKRNWKPAFPCSQLDYGKVIKRTNKVTVVEKTVKTKKQINL